MARELIVLGAGLPARGRSWPASAPGSACPPSRCSWPPGSSSGPTPPGRCSSNAPSDLELLAAFGLIFLMFFLGVEFSVDDLVSGGRKLGRLGRRLPPAERRGRAGHRLRLRLGLIGGVRDRRCHRHLVVGHRHQGPGRAAPPRQPRDAPDPRHHRHRGRLPGVVPGGHGAGAGQGRDHRRGLGAVRQGGRLPGRAGPAGAVRVLAGRQDLRTPTTTSCWSSPRWVWPCSTAGISHGLGLSDAIGAFLAGLVLAPTMVAARVKQARSSRSRDTFAAVFFFAFGLTVDPADARSVAVPALACAVAAFVLTMARRHRRRPTPRVGSHRRRQHRPDHPGPGRVRVDPGQPGRRPPASTPASPVRGPVRARAGRGQSHPGQPVGRRSPGSSPAGWSAP